LTKNIRSSVINYVPDPALDAVAEEHGSRFRDIIYKGSGRSELHAYLNYAHGDESLQAIYGYEPWRLALLKELKHKYDPLGCFNFYEPF
jgi:hypothetical protein